MTLKIVLLVIAFSSISLFGFGQNQIDSLKQVLRISDNDSINVRTLNSLASEYLSVSTDTALIYATKALGLAEKQSNHRVLARSYYFIGAAYYYSRDYRSAIDNWKEQLKIYKEAQDTSAMLPCYSSIGGALWYVGDFESAIVIYKESVMIAHKEGNMNVVADNYRNIGGSYWYQGNIDTAIVYFEKAIDAFKLADDQINLAGSYLNMQSLYSSQGDYVRSLQYSFKAYQIYDELGSVIGKASSYKGIGITYWNQGDYDEALNYANKSLSLYKEIDNIDGIGDCYNNIGIIYLRQGVYDKATDNLFNSIEIAKQLNDKESIANSLGNIGIIFMNQGSYDKSLIYYRKALDMYREIGRNYGIASCYHNIGDINYKQNQYDSAIVNFQRAIEINKADGNAEWLSNNYEGMASVYYDREEYTKSKKLFLESLEIRKNIGDKLGIATSYNGIANFYLKLSTLSEYEGDNPIDSTFYYSNKALTIAQDISVLSEQKMSFFILAKVNWKIGEFESAISNFNQLILIDNSNILMNFSFISEEEKENYFSTIAYDYEIYNSFVLDNMQQYPKVVGDVFNNTIKNKGLLLKSSTAMRNAVLNSNDSALIAKYNEWIILKKEISVLNSVQKEERDRNLEELEEEANDIERYMVKNSLVFSDFAKIQELDWKDVQNNLMVNEAAIEFIHFDLFDVESMLEFTDTTIYCALVVTKTSQYPEMIPLFNEKDLEKILGKFGGNNLKYIQGIYGDSSLYNLIWKPMEERLKGVKKVYISPDGLLHKVSFPAISKDQDVYLCDIYDIELKSSTGKIVGSGVNTHGRVDKTRTATLFGGINYDTDSTTYQGWTYLEGTKTETQKIDKILKKRKVEVNYFSNTSATEEEFKLMASNSNIIHIATHGFFYPDPKEVALDIDTVKVVEEIAFRGGSRGFGVNSFVENSNPLMRSGLVFAGSNDVWSKQTENDSIDDGVLTAQEVAHIDMRETELVVMSACETGLGDIKGSEGVYGLQRAFKMAGVDYMIMSLWQVPDKETEEFMTKFYKKLMKSKDIKRSFNETQKEMRAKYDPYFWAAFVLIE